MRWGICAVRGSSEIVLHPEVPGPGLLDDGMAEGSGEEYQRPFAFRDDVVDVFLQHDAGAAVKFVKEWLDGSAIFLRDELRAVSGRGDSRLHHCLVPAKVA